MAVRLHTTGFHDFQAEVKGTLERFNSREVKQRRQRFRDEFEERLDLYKGLGLNEVANDIVGTARAELATSLGFPVIGIEEAARRMTDKRPLHIFKDSYREMASGEVRYTTGWVQRTMESVRTWPVLFRYGPLNEYKGKTFPYGVALKARELIDSELFDELVIMAPAEDMKVANPDPVLMGRIRETFFFIAQW